MDFLFPHKDVFGVISFVVMIVDSFPYIRSVMKGETKPHLFSWVIWHVVDDIAVVAQITAGAGAGIWATLAGSLASFVVMVLAVKKRSQIKISKLDWVTFIVALSAIPIWAITKEPLTAAVIATVINAAAFTITIRKIWHDPSSENATAYGMYSLGWLFGIAALGDYNLTSTLYPVIGLLMNVLTFAAIILLPLLRKTLPKHSE